MRVNFITPVKKVRNNRGRATAWFRRAGGAGNNQHFYRQTGKNTLILELKRRGGDEAEEKNNEG
jgi:hypothetical protein